MPGTPDYSPYQVLPFTLPPEGIYKGEWRGYQVTIPTATETFELATSVGLRGSMEVAVICSGGIARVYQLHEIFLWVGFK